MRAYQDWAGPLLANFKGAFVEMMRQIGRALLIHVLPRAQQVAGVEASKEAPPGDIPAAPVDAADATAASVAASVEALAGASVGGTLAKLPPSPVLEGDPAAPEETLAAAEEGQVRACIGLLCCWRWRSQGRA